MSNLDRYLEKAVQYGASKPFMLSSYLKALVTPVVIPADILSVVEVANGTTLAAVKTSLGATLESTVDGIPFTATVSWSADSTPTYAPATAGSYVLTGTISGLPSYVANTGSKTVLVTVVVKAA